jgi:hypothetical protein
MDLNRAYIVPQTLEFNFPGAVKATAVLTATAIVLNNETVTIGETVYTFKTTLTGAAFEVLIGVSLATALDNLKVAINAGAGEGTVYGTGTTAHPDVTATTNTDTAQTIEAKVANAAGNLIATTETSTVASWGGLTMSGGAGVLTLTLPVGKGGGIVNKILTITPAVAGAALTADIEILDEDSNQLLLVNDQAESAVAATAVGYILAPSDNIKVTYSAIPGADSQIAVVLR